MMIDNFDRQSSCLRPSPLKSEGVFVIKFVSSYFCYTVVIPSLWNNITGKIWQHVISMLHNSSNTRLGSVIFPTPDVWVLTRQVIPTERLLPSKLVGAVLDN